MLLAIDAGNTNTVFAVFEGETLRGQWRLSTDPHRTADEYAVLLNDLMALKQISFAEITAAIIANVVPQSQFALKTFCTDYAKVTPLVVGEEGVRTQVGMNVENPKEVGADRLVNAEAAYAEYGGDVVVVDFGTATTFDVISKEGCYEGGVIAPGIHLSLEALRRAAAKLPEIVITKPEKVVGKATVPAMQSGIYWGYIGLIEGIISRLKEEWGVSFTVIATGGLAPLFAKGTSAIHHLAPDLTIYGLKRIYEHNR